MSRAPLSGALALLLAACDNPADPPSSVDTLRVLAVRADPPTGRPGQEVSLELLVVDGAPAARSAPRPIEIAWLGGCDNPGTDLPSSCFDGLNRWVPGLRRDDLAAKKIPEDGSVPAGALGYGTTFRVRLSPDLISRHAPPEPGMPAYGLAMTFFAVCAGHLRPVAPSDAPSGVPLGCFSPSGERLGPGDFVVGYMPVRAYEVESNTAPIVDGALLDGRVPGGANCDAGCPASEACGSAGRCVPVVPPCDADDTRDCDGTPFVPRVDPASVEEDRTSAVPGPELLWVSYFTDSGLFADDARVVHESGGGFRSLEAQSGRFLPARGHRGPARLWAVVRDHRGGVAWVEQEVLVR